MRVGGDKFRSQGKGRKGKEKGGEAGLGRAGLGICRPPGPNPGTPASRRPAAGNHAPPPQKKPDRHLLKDIFRVIHGERTRASRNPPTTLLWRSRRRFESAAQPQSLQRAFPRHLVIGLRRRWAGQSPGPLPADKPHLPAERQGLYCSAQPC